MNFSAQGKCSLWQIMNYSSIFFHSL